MKKLLTLAAMLAVAVILSGCQNSDDSKSSNSEQDDENSIVMNDGQNDREMDSEGCGDESYDLDDSCGDAMDEACDEGMDDCDLDYPCGEGMDDDDLDDPCGEGLDDDDLDYPCGDGMDDPCGDGTGEDDLDDPCGDGTGDDGEGNGGIPQFEEGTAEDAIMQLWKIIKDGKQEGLDNFISLRAKGDLAALRNGNLAAEKFDALKQQLARVKLLNTRKSGSSRTISLQNEDGRIFRFTCKKENGKYVVREFLNKEPSKSKRRKKY